jgi:predicted RNA-binding Zn-ribbon protein involved in translation (DUF1610 family)
MKVVYDIDDGTRTYTCPTCGYKYKKEAGAYGKVLEGDEAFIEMEDFALHSTDRSGYYPSHNSHAVYACPKCGVLQLWT